MSYSYIFKLTARLAAVFNQIANAAVNIDDKYRVIILSPAKDSEINLDSILLWYLI